MNARTSIFAASAALVASGFYVFVYLVRWEWHRAIISALFLLAAEVAVLALVGAARLARIESKLDELGERPLDNREERARLEHHIQATAPKSEAPFKWLTDAEGLSVFVPILLGAGVVLSALAWLVERLAKMTAGTLLARRLAGELVPLMVAPGALSGTSLPYRPKRTAGAPPASHGRLSVWVMGLLVVALGAVALDELGDATQNRPDPTPVGSISTVIVEVRSVIPKLGDVTGVSNMWGGCVPQLGGRFTRLSTERIGDGLIAVTVRPAIGKHTERRLRGCLGDAGSDRMAAQVVQITRTG